MDISCDISQDFERPLMWNWTVELKNIRGTYRRLTTNRYTMQNNPSMTLTALVFFLFLFYHLLPNDPFVQKKNTNCMDQCRTGALCACPRVPPRCQWCSPQRRDPSRATSTPVGGVRHHAFDLYKWNFTQPRDGHLENLHVIVMLYMMLAKWCKVAVFWS